MNIKIKAGALVIFGLGGTDATTAALAAPCPHTLSAAEQVVALNEIQNLMGRYSHVGAEREEGTLAELFAMKTPESTGSRPLTAATRPRSR